MDIKRYLLSWKEYNKKEFKIPYVFKIEKENQILTYFGAKHTNDHVLLRFTLGLETLDPSPPNPA